MKRLNSFSSIEMERLLLVRWLSLLRRSCLLVMMVVSALVWQKPVLGLTVILRRLRLLWPLQMVLFYTFCSWHYAYLGSLHTSLFRWCCFFVDVSRYRCLLGGRRILCVLTSDTWSIGLGPSDCLVSLLRLPCPRTWWSCRVLFLLFRGSRLVQVQSSFGTFSARHLIDYSDDSFLDFEVILDCLWADARGYSLDDCLNIFCFKSPSVLLECLALEHLTGFGVVFAAWKL